MKRIIIMLTVCALGGFVSGCAHSGAGGGDTSRFVQLDASDNIFSVAYYPDSSKLSVVFLREAGRDFKGVPRDLYEGLVASPQPDAFFKEKIAGKFEETEWSF